MESDNMPAQKEVSNNDCDESAADGGFLSVSELEFKESADRLSLLAEVASEFGSTDFEPSEIWDSPSPASEIGTPLSEVRAIYTAHSHLRREQVEDEANLKHEELVESKSEWSGESDKGDRAEDLDVRILSWSPEQLQVVEELKRKAHVVKECSIGVFTAKKPGKFSDAELDVRRRAPLSPEKEKCTICYEHIGKHFQARRRHYLTHYPSGFFCPVCLKIFIREDSLARHWRTSKRCLERPEAAFFTLRHEETGKVVCGIDKLIFNIYALGVMEDYDMPDRHFRLCARRRRNQNIP